MANVNSLLEHFERLHLHHLSSRHQTEDYCRKEFARKLKQWTGTARKRKNRTYVEACTDRRQQQCRYVIRVFDQDDEGKLQFAHEIRVLQALSDQKVDFVPPVHTAFLCQNYGLLVQSKWEGDIVDLLFAQKEAQLEATFQRAHHMAQVMLTELHRAGFCYGQNAIDFRHLIVCRQPQCPDVMKADAGFHLGLQDWRGARPFSPEGAEQDLHHLNILFMELAALIQALRHHHPNLPEHLPAALRNKALKLREW